MDLPDYTLFIQIANFLFLIFVLNIIAYRPIRAILEKRKEEMTTDANITKDWIQKAEQSSEELENNRSVTQKEGLKEKDSLKDQGTVQEREMLKEAYKTVEENIEQARSEIQEKLHQVSRTLQEEMEGFSQELAEKILGRGI
jgi:F-type H+-transporting ATPase subunit b